jgi:hypothetical protein
MTAPHLFLDLDGVLADFDGHVIRHTGLEPAATPPKDLWRAIGAVRGFWEGIEPFPYTADFWAIAKRWKPTIITGLPVSKTEVARDAKLAWVARHLGEDVPVITCWSRDKPAHMKAPGDILVDDRPSNVNDWAAAGGRALLWDGPGPILSRITEIMLRASGDMILGGADPVVVLRARALYHLQAPEKEFDEDFIRGMAARAYAPRPNFTPAQVRQINRLALKYGRHIDQRLVPASLKQAETV